MHLLIHRTTGCIDALSEVVASRAIVCYMLLLTGCDENNPTETADISGMTNGDTAALIGLAIALAAILFESLFNRSHDDRYR